MSPCSAPGGWRGGPSDSIHGGTQTPAVQTSPVVESMREYLLSFAAGFYKRTEVTESRRQRRHSLPGATSLFLGPSLEASVARQVSLGPPLCDLDVIP